MNNIQTYYADLMVGTERHSGASERALRIVSIPDRAVRLWINTMLEEVQS